MVARRIEVIESNRNIGLIERPECKRRWQSGPWEVKEAPALGTWLLDRCEERSLWFDQDGSPSPMTVNRPGGPVACRLLAQYRYKPSGMDKRRLWERTWDLQWEEDATSKRLDIPVPPKYASADFRQDSY